MSWLRDRISNAVKGKPQQAEPGDGRRRVGPADPDPRERRERRRAHRGRLAVPGGRSAAARRRRRRTSARASRDFRARSDRAVRDWQQGVLDLVRKEGADKRTTARFLAYGVNGLAVALMVVVFASTAGITGAEVGIAGGSAVVGAEAAGGGLRRPGRTPAGHRRPPGPEPACAGAPRCRAQTLRRAAGQAGGLHDVPGGDPGGGAGGRRPPLRAEEGRT